MSSEVALQQDAKVATADIAVEATKTASKRQADAMDTAGSPGESTVEEVSKLQPQMVGSVSVGGLPFKISQEQLEEDFAKCGEIGQLIMKRNNSGVFKGVALIDFRTQVGVAEVLKLNGSKDKYEGRTLIVKQRLEPDHGEGKSRGEKDNGSKEKKTKGSNQAQQAKSGKLKNRDVAVNLLPMITKLLEVHAARNFEALASLASELADKARAACAQKTDYPVIVRNIPREGVTEATLKEAFAACGELKKISMPKTGDGMIRGFANLYFKTPEGQKSALKRSGSKIQGKKITVFQVDQKNSTKPVGGKGKPNHVKEGQLEANSNKRKVRNDNADATAKIPTKGPAKKKMRTAEPPDEGVVSSEALVPEGSCSEKSTTELMEPVAANSPTQEQAAVESSTKKSKAAAESAVALVAEPIQEPAAESVAEPKKRMSVGFNHWFELRREKIRQGLAQGDDLSNEAVLRREAKRRWAELSDEKRAKFEEKALVATGAKAL